MSALEQASLAEVPASATPDTTTAQILAPGTAVVFVPNRELVLENAYTGVVHVGVDGARFTVLP